MERYLQYLLTDIEALIEQAPVPAESSWNNGFAEEEELSDIPLRSTKICDLIGLPAEAFPPENKLTDLQVIELVEAFDDLWSAWLLHWEMPSNLPVRKQYEAFRREMNGAAIFYHPEDGGDVHICQFEEGKSCPFGSESTTCHCREMDESSKHDIALWEEYVHSQGLDPYREMTAEEEALFEEEMRHRDLKKRYGDDWQKFDMEQELIFDQDMDEEEQEEFLYALEVADELLGLILENLAESDSDILQEDEEEENDFPF